MKWLEGRVAVITGAGRGIGREHALAFAAQGAKVVVNDLAVDGASPADDVVAEIRAAGGEAAANHDDVTTWTGAERLVQQAIETYSSLDVVVNNAGILRDGFIATMTEADWDAVVRVHLKGHFLVTRHAAAYFKARAKAGDVRKRAVVNTVSGSGTILPNAGQANYGAAKAGIAALTLVAAEELERYHVRVNAIAPMARTRLTADVPGFGALFAAPNDPHAFDAFHPRNVSPLVVYLASDACPLTGRVFSAQGGAISELEGWRGKYTFETKGPWSLDEIAARVATVGGAR